MTPELTIPEFLVGYANIFSDILAQLPLLQLR